MSKVLLVLLAIGLFLIGRYYFNRHNLIIFDLTITKEKLTIILGLVVIVGASAIVIYSTPTTLCAFFVVGVSLTSHYIKENRKKRKP